MRQTCKQCSTAFDVTDDDLALLKKNTLTVGGQEFDLPPPTLCFHCRLRRRMAFYNARSLYRDTCDLTGKEIISIYSPDKPFTVYDCDVWYGDAWDPLSSGRDFDFSRPFSEQFRELMEAVPMLSRGVLGSNENADYTNDNQKLKNCYLIFDGERAEDCYFGHTFAGLKNCMNFFGLVQSELCYGVMASFGCYNLYHSRFCANCSDSWFLRSCGSCRDCFGCCNVRQKQYCIFNEQKTKEEFETFMKEFHSSSHAAMEAMRKKVEAFFATQPMKSIRGDQNIDSIGDALMHCKNAHMCFDSIGLQDSRYCTNCLMGGNDCMDIHAWGDGMELCYDSCIIGINVRNVLSGYYIVEGSDNALYSIYCSSGCNNLLGCVGLRRKNHCILNKQYTKEEYAELAPKIIEHMKKTGEWGEFFPTEISMFGYNETMAQHYFPLTREETIARGWQWCDYEAPVSAARSIPASQLPDDVNETPDDVLDWAVECEVTGKPFKIIKQELDFCRQHHLPLPRRHPDQRYRDLLEYIHRYRLYERQCTKCQKTVQTTHSPGKPEPLICEECYLKAVY